MWKGAETIRWLMWTAPMWMRMIVLVHPADWRLALAGQVSMVTLSNEG